MAQINGKYAKQVVHSIVFGGALWNYKSKSLFAPRD